MRLSSPIDAVASAIHHAANVAFPDICYRKHDHEAMRDWSAAKRREAVSNHTIPEIDARRRPDPLECEVVAMFAQTWGSTALGFGGLGGAAMTPAYTVVVMSPQGHLAVYWAGRLAYLIDLDQQTEEQQQVFKTDLAKGLTVNVAQARSRYGALTERGADDAA